MSESDRNTFIDSNVLLYLLADDSRKRTIARTLLKCHPTVSVQVLDEVTNVCRRKLELPWPGIDEIIDVVQQLCTVVPLSIETHHLARQVASRYGTSFYDACIVASAMLSRCPVLYTEDMHHGLKIGPRLTVKNPFR